MATLVSTLRDSLKREINLPGFEQLPDVSNAQLDGYIKDGFWEARLLGILSSYTQTDGTEFATPPGEVIYETDNLADLPPQYRQLIVIVAGLRILRLKALNLAMSIRAKAGSVEYEQQMSATVLREILQSLERRLKQLEVVYGTSLGESAFTYFDGELQRTQSVMSGLAQLTVY